MNKYTEEQKNFYNCFLANVNGAFDVFRGPESRNLVA